MNKLIILLLTFIGTTLSQTAPTPAECKAKRTEFQAKAAANQARLTEFRKEEIKAHEQHIVWDIAKDKYKSLRKNATAADT